MGTPTASTPEPVPTAPSPPEPVAPASPPPEPVAPAPSPPEPAAPAPPRSPSARPGWGHQVVERIQRRRRLLIVLAALLVLYTVFGFLILPIIVRRQLEKRLTAALHRETTVARVRTNPYALSVTIDGLLVKDPDGTPFVSWDRLYVNLAGWRVVLRELSLEKIALVRFHARVAMDKRGRFNFQDLLEESASSTPEPPPTTEKKKPLLVFAVQELDIQQAQVDFSDRSHRSPFETTVGPFDILLKDFRARPDSTSPYSFAGRTESGETFSWAGNLLTEPLRSMGTITFEGLRLSKYSPYYAPEVGFEVRDGQLGVKTLYTLEWGPERHVLEVSDGSVILRSLVLGIPGTAEPKLDLPEADVSGIAVDVVGGNAQVKAVVLKNGVVRARRNSEGALDLEKMGPPQSSSPPPKETSASPPKEKGKPFDWKVGRVELAGWRLELQDEMPARPVSLKIAPLDVRLEALAGSPQQSSHLMASIGFAGKGKVGLEGSVKLLRPAGDVSITVEALDLPQLDPYLDLYGNLAGRLGSGRLDLKGNARFDAGAEPAAWAFEADTRVDNLTLLESERNQEIARWKGLQISGIKTASSPPGLSIRSVRWVQPQIRVAVAEDGSSNVNRLLKTPSPPPGSAKQPPEVAAKPESAKQPPEVAANPEGAKQPPEVAGKPESEEEPAEVNGPPSKPDRAQPPWSLASFQIVRGTVTIDDRSVAPPMTLPVTDVDVRLRGLSNSLKNRSQLSIKALFAGAPLEVTGTVSPRMVNDATDVKVISKGTDLTPFSPYCGKYAGYVLDKGTVDLDLDYKVAKRRLKGSNHVKVEHLALGEATHSKDATKLPVKLGLAVLEDPSGVIDQIVPVKGNVDDPGFRLYRVVGNAFFNVFVKAIESPFTLLAKAFGGGANDKLDLIDFQAGAPELTPSADKALQTLSKALAGRPSLRMDLEGTTDPVGDVKALRARELKRQAATTQPEKGQKAEPSDEEYLKLVEKRWRSLAPANQSATPPDPATMEDAVVATVQLPPEALGSLRQQRAETARARLVALGVDPGRLSLTQGGERAKKEAGARVYFTLK